MVFELLVNPQFRDADHDGLIGLRGCMRCFQDAHTYLDKSRHMNNLRYIEMFQDAYESSFWSALDPHEMEIRFLSQCKEGETISVCSRTDDTGVHFAALHQDGTLASTALFGA